jgi:hypothetical protein
MGKHEDRGGPVVRRGPVVPSADEPGLLSRPEAEPMEPHDHGQAEEHDEHGHEHHDHDSMFFQPWRLGADGEVHEVPLDEMTRDTSSFVDGRDPGIGTGGVQPAPHDHDGGGHGH